MLARADAQIERVVEATAILSEDLQLRSLNFCSELLNEKDAKGLQMASGAARNFVQISRLCRRLDTQPGGNFQNGSGPQTTLVFVGDMPRAARAEPKPVTEVSAQVVPDSPTLT